jgi:hypothetical protein
VREVLKVYKPLPFVEINPGKTWRGPLRKASAGTSETPARWRRGLRRKSREHGTSALPGASRQRGRRRYDQ